LGTNSAFALGPRKTIENLDWVGQSQDLPNADLTSSQQSGINSTNPNTSPYSVQLYFSFLFFSFFSTTSYFVFTIICMCIWVGRPPLWSSGQSSWLQIRRPGFDSWHYQKKKSSGSGTGSTQPCEYNWGATW
jgi:ribosomal protein L37E